jgi:hypothetical protein
VIAIAIEAGLCLRQLKLSLLRVFVVCLCRLSLFFFGLFLRSFPWVFHELSPTRGHFHRDVDIQGRPSQWNNVVVVTYSYSVVVLLVPPTNQDSRYIIKAKH